MLYLTLGEGWSGVLSSQVVDACRYLEHVGGRPVTLACFVSLRGFVSERRRIRAAYPGAIVLPMVPRLQNWRLNYALLRFVVMRTGERRVMTRGALAHQLALRLRDAGVIDLACLDGRGAQAAEWHEYDVVPSQRLKDEIAALEGDAVHRADFRLAVSNALVDHWREAYGYRDDRHVVVPCTVGASFQADLPSPLRRAEVRASLGFAPGDVVLAFAGAIAGWQSLGLLDEMFCAALARDPRVRVLMLSDLRGAKLRAVAEYPQRVKVAWVQHDRMFETLAACDHGVLLREQSVTNRVAAPTKLAEYLAAGLDAVVSPGIGDYSEMVGREGCGVVVGDPAHPPRFEPVGDERRQRNHDLALRLFTKAAHHAAYRRLLDVMGP